MIIKIEYKDDKEREDVLANNNHLYMIGDSNLLEGNFLFFSDDVNETLSRDVIIYKDVPKEHMEQLENALLEMSTLQAMKDIENEQAIMELTTMITMMGGM